MSRELQLLYRRALRNGSAELLPVWFRSEVLDVYRGRPGCSVIRSRSAGRVKLDGAWSLDFGISADDTLIHVSWRDLHSRLPEKERNAWLEQIEAPPVSAAFLQMQMAPGSCFDDGEVEPWQ
ncbi:MAG: hypothetical protein WEB00_11230 [Dehalococcoidia bacterium]